MCTAYKVGNRGHISEQLKSGYGFEVLVDIKSPRIVRPTHKAPVVMPDGSMREMIWGFRRKVPAVKSKTRWQTIVNSREDKLGGRIWSGAFSERRCLIPAYSFFEWVSNSAGGMMPLEFEDSAGGMLWVAGIWEQDPERGEVYSMITTEPNAVVGPVHDRMPAVLAETQFQRFLSGELNEFGPSSVALSFAAAENFLGQKKNDEPPPAQGELFG